MALLAGAASVPAENAQILAAKRGSLIMEAGSLIVEAGVPFFGYEPALAAAANDFAFLLGASGLELLANSSQFAGFSPVQVRGITIINNSNNNSNKT